MSRSHKKSPFSGFTTAKSEKQDKIIASRRLRTKEKNILKHIDVNNLDELDELLLPDTKEITNPYTFAKDGKSYYKKTDSYYEKIMRK